MNLTFDPMVPVAGAVVVFLLSVGLIVLAGVTGQRRGRVLRIVRRVLIAVAILAIGLRPGIPDLAERTVIASDIDVFVVVDTTGSAAAEDYDGDETRLSGMKADVLRIVEAFPGARVSLLTFDAEAVIRVPLTHDASALASALEVLRPEFSLYSTGTSISEPVSLLQATLKDAKESEPSHQRVLFYLGDGEQTVTDEPESFADLAGYVENGAVLGYGTEAGGRMLENRRFDFGDDEEDEPTYIQDYTQFPATDARSIIDEDNLRTIADELGVGYQHRTQPDDIDGLAAMNTPGEVELADGGTSTFELYWAFALAAFALLLWEAIAVAVGLVEAFAAGRRRS